MKIKKLITTITLTISALSLNPSAHAKNFRLGLITPANHIWTESAERFAEDFKAASGNEHQVSIFPAGQLGNEAAMLQQLQTGALDMAFITAAELSNRHQEMGILFAPFLVENIDQVPSLLASEPAQELLKNLVKKTGVIGIAYGTGGLRQISSVNPVNQISDLRGKKLRITPQAPLQDFYRAMNAAPISLPLSGVYDAMTNKQADGTDMDLEIIVGLKLYEIAETTVLSNHMIWPVVGVVSARVWQTLSDDDKQNIQKLMTQRLDETGALYSEKEHAWTETLKATGKPVKEVGPEFFGTILTKWEEKWSKQSPLLKELRAVSTEIKQ